MDIRIFVPIILFVVFITVVIMLLVVDNKRIEQKNSIEENIYFQLIRIKSWIILIFIMVLIMLIGYCFLLLKIGDIVEWWRSVYNNILNIFSK